MTADQPGQPLAVATPRLQLLVPAYFYPAGPGLKAWQHLIEAASKIKIVAIANPNSGPGDQRNGDYYLVLQAASDKGIRVVGYVSTDYGNRRLPEVRRRSIAGSSTTRRSTASSSISNPAGPRTLRSTPRSATMPARRSRTPS